jgi:SAM-dependent methyltransferase
MKFTDLLRKPQRNQAVCDLPPADRDVRDYFVRAQYQPRLAPQYFEDFSPGTNERSHQPDVYSLAEFFASLSIRRVIDVGCGKGEKLRPLAHRFEIIGLDIGANIEHCRRTFLRGEWISHDLESDRDFPLAGTRLDDSIVICADVIEHLINPMPLLRNLRKCAGRGACVVLSTPERDLARGMDDSGPPPNPSHVREWTIGELRALLQHMGFDIPFLGLTANNSVDRQMSTIIAVLRDGGVVERSGS